MRVRVNGKTVELHRHIMEQHLKRELITGEVVHHINGDILDNRIENLQLMTDSEHRSLHSKRYRHSEETKKLMSDIRTEYYKTHEHASLGYKHTKEMKRFFSERQMGPKNHKWIEGEVSSHILAQRKYRTKQRIKEGRGTSEDFLFFK